MIRVGWVAALSLACTVAMLAVACGSGSSSPASPTSPSSSNPQPGSCQVYGEPGSYTLSRDVPCLWLVASNLTVDCAHHVVSGPISHYSGQSNISLRNCQLSSMILTGISRWTITNSTFQGGLFVGNAQGFVLQNDTFLGPVTSSTGSALVYLNGGSGNTVTGSSFDGGYTGQCNQCGADDAILLVDESGDTIQGNTIQNTWDTGVEGVDTVTNTTIADNSITNTANAGIGSFWCTDWQGNRVTGNQITASATAMDFYYSVGTAQCGNAPPADVFRDNTIANNTFRNPIPIPTDGLALIFHFVEGHPTSSNNVLQGNDMGTLGIYATPPQSFINGGGNVCSSAGTFAC